MDYMARALSLARLALGQVSPNPAVGAVIVNAGEVVGQGYTQPPGSHHAEVVALRQAGKQARGGVMYVTLEPCCYYGRTPPCTEAIIAAGITEVHLSVLDVNPLVSGRGKEVLERAGIKVYVGEGEAEARQINRAYIKFTIQGIPLITAKFAVSLDGKIATRSGDSRWISGELSRRYVHNMRYVSDAIMVGANTVLSDDPLLTARFAGNGGRIRKQPLRVVVDGRGRTSLTARVFSEPGRSVVVLGRLARAEEKAAFTQAGVTLLELPSAKEGQVDMVKLLEKLAQQGITSVLVEGGGVLLGSLFDARLVDKVVVFIAPIIIGGRDAKTAVAGRGVDKVVNSFKLDRVSVEKLGKDLMVCGDIQKT
ncbi:MAG: bifunctional diaminohydroxyphosphoribosylaminopyrimidine deaminase/5-amino-6-(5-phosphoribosylamino)uracil reductase RibD [Dehalococcoidales bacterium]|nr:bifunctional diaminohydroxyphosphoribosylaminopyrimidine deaminase/5-amino-6-(5-phosphoribosylamino)uracil reductase RibD [Dehalococcoidales bacterium]